MGRRRRDFKAEYARRIARGVAKGLSRTQSRGHPRVSEIFTTRRAARPIDDDRLQLALRVLRQERSLTSAARAVKIAPETLRRIASEGKFLERRGRRWRVRPDLPRRVLVYANGQELVITVGSFHDASTIGKFMSSVRTFLRTNRPSILGEFSGQKIYDIRGTAYVLETKPNRLYRIAVTSDRAFEEVYRVVV